MSLKDREDAFENRYAHDETKRFRIESRRNRLVARWAAEQLGHTGEAADAYAKELTTIGSSREGIAGIEQRIAADFGAAGLGEAATGIKAKVEVSREEAERQVNAE